MGECSRFVLSVLIWLMNLVICEVQGMGIGFC